MQESAPQQAEPDQDNQCEQQVLIKLRSQFILVLKPEHHTDMIDLHYYWRQLKDMKGSVDARALDEDGCKTYVAVCAVCLARAHARAGDAAAISGYMGKGKSLGKAIADFAVAYADQTESDHQALVEAVESDRIQAQTGI